MKRLKFLGCLLFTAFPVWAGPRVCVLNYERENHPTTALIDKLFKNVPDTKVVHEARPLDLVSCFEEGYQEIIVFTHARVDEKGNFLDLNYVLRLDAAERDEFVKNHPGEVKDWLAKDVEELSRHPQRWRNTSSSGRSMSMGRSPVYDAERNRLIEQIDWLKKRLKWIESLEPSEILYQADQKFLLQPFRDIRSLLEQRRLNHEPILTKRIRFMSCASPQILKRYKDLAAAVEENQIQVDFAPKNNLGSFIRGHDVSTIDLVWLAESAQPNRGADDDWFFTYLELGTCVLFRHGSAHALHGQYKIEIDGLAVGLSSKWSMVYLKYGDLKNLEIGQSKEFVQPHIDASIALFANLELGILPRPKIQLPSEINSIGVEIGLASKVKVTRLY